MEAAVVVARVSRERVSMSAVETLITRGDTLFGNRTTLLTHWQDIAEQFYPQRADFTVSRTLGEEFASHLYSSYPLIVHRELSTSIASILRKRDTEWFHITVEDDEDLSLAGREWLEFATKRQRKAMYDRRSQFIRATTEGDADFTAFGQTCISHEIDWTKARPHLLYRCWHLRDVAWAERYDGTIGEIHVRWNPRVEELKRLFPGKLHPSVERLKDNDAMQKINCRRVIIAQDLYHGETKFAQPHTIVYVDVDNKHIMAEVGVWTQGFTLPRWQTVSGSQYAYSPAVVAGLPDARLIQAMTLTLLEAGEMAVRPPLVATQDAIREDVQWFPGGITWADVEYDERKGDVLRPISQDKSGIPYGMDAAAEQRAMLATAFYLNKLTLPAVDHDMTATEVRERIQEYIRSALPLFEPMETQYNAVLCDQTFQDLLRAGAFGSVQDVPSELRGREIDFKFTSPLHDAIERDKAATFVETAELIKLASELDPAAMARVDITTALKDALEGIRAPADWNRTDDEIKQIIEEHRQQAEAMRTAEIAEQAGNAVESISNVA